MGGRPAAVVAVAVAVVALLTVPAGAAGAATLPAGAAGAATLPAGAAGAATVLGSDISWPQCGSAYPAKPGFAVMGANDGRPNTANPCLISEDAWATQSGTAMFYMNTANPGVADSEAYSYGWSAAQWAYLYVNRFVSAGPGHLWWLDVETGNSWLGSQADNTADLEGSLAYFASKKVSVGIYSTAYQWGIITGGASIPSVLNWVPGAATAARAPAYCSATRSFSGGPVYMVQYTTQFDYDLLCPGMTLPKPSAPPPNLLAALLNGLINWLKGL